jgi:hypothetical protein
MPLDYATLTIVAHAARAGNCELCADSALPLTASVVVRHVRGGQIQFLACERCAAASRRLAAARGSGGVTEVVEAIPAPVAVPPAAVAEAVVPVPAVRPRAAPHGPPRLIAQLNVEVVDASGQRWAPSVYGESRADGSWIGWLEFQAVGGTAVRRTRQDTSQPDVGALTYWAGGLEPTFLEGAFNRAR